MKILIDMNLSPRWATALTAAGFPCVHWSAVGPITASDPEIIRFAREGDWVILTQDLDVGAILAATRGDKPSVVQRRSEEVSPESAGQTVVAAIRQARGELQQGALVTVDPRRTRLRYLPLKPATD